MQLITNFDEKNILNVLLEGAGLDAFIFHTNFQLKFCCENRKKFNGKDIPMQINLSISSDWWFGDKKEWDKIVDKLTNGFNFVEQDEPVLAFELAALRWTDGSVINSVDLSSEKLELKFECGASITIMNHTEMDYAWEIYEEKFNDYNNRWSVLCEDGKIYYNMPI